ncbi:MAG: hypothetical protein ACYTFO_07580, partial [Planctomycetota bacterium]
MRVRFRLLDRMAEADTVISLPDHLARAFGCAELPASQFAATWRDLARGAAQRLATFKTEEGRTHWQRHAMLTSFEQ